MQQVNADSFSNSADVRKRLLPQEGEIDIGSQAVLACASDDPDHPIDHLADGHCGRAGSARSAALEPAPISDLRLTIVPDKHGRGPAKLRSLRLFAAESRSDT